mgnify:CR=1 FL=1
MDKGTVIVLSIAIVTVGIILVVAMLTGHDTVLTLSGLTMIGGMVGYRVGRRR